MFAKNYIMARFALVLILVVGMIGLQPVPPVRADTLIVTNTSDSAIGSLRDMVARARFGTNTITFDPSLAGQTITLLSDLEFFMGDITIDGSGLSPQITISGGNAAHIETAGLVKLAISNLILTDGNDGAIYARGQSLTLTNVILKNNHSDGHGGALNISTYSSLIDNCTFSQNQANGDGGAVYIGGSLNNFISDSTFTQNQADYGGAISANGSLIIRNSTIDQNSAVYRGGAIMFGVASYSTIINSTITRNWTENYGGAIFMDGNAESNIFNSTFAGNGATTGSEVDLRGSASLYAYNTIFACLPGASTCYSYFGSTMLSLTNSIMETGTLADFGLAELADNGGATQTMALYGDSSLVDAGDDSICANALVNNLDQRGAARPQGSHCDIGAYEFQSKIFYVKHNATGLNDGTSWANAYTDLQSALAAAAEDDEIWVAAGTYKPTTGTDRTVSFVLKNDVAIYGGFAGTETVRTQRDFKTNVTVLSGDIGVAENSSNNSYHVVVGGGTTDTAVLDGFTVLAGNANHTLSNSVGGGMLNENGSPTLSNLIFSNNSANGGGGMFNSNSNPRLVNVTFLNNIAYSSYRGGGMINSNSSNPIMLDVTFDGNSAEAGGGMYNYDSNPSLEGVVFINNTANTNGGGIYNDAYSNANLMNVTFQQNTADWGGGIYNYSCSPTLTNVTINNNSAKKYGGGILNDYSNPTLVDVTITANTADWGGGIMNRNSSPTLKNIMISNNISTTYGGGVYNYSGNPTLTNVIINHNAAGAYGGGILNDYSHPTLVNATVTANTATWGGGMMNNYSSLTLTNGTFYGNSAADSGGAIANGNNSTLTLTHVTINGNSAVTKGDGFHNDNSTLTIRNSILYGNGEEIYGPATVTYSIVQGGHAGTGNLNVNPLLSPLADNDGFTQTMALSTDSPAIDAGNDSYCPATDQRGVTRPQGSHCDIGAYEAIQTTHSIPLPPGWNLVSFNVHPTDTSVSSVLSSIAGNYDLVYAWDASGAHAGSGNWLRADNLPESPDSLTSLHETMGFWIRMTVADTLEVTGTVPQSTNVSLLDNASGWNLVGYPANTAGNLPNVLSEHGVGTDFSMLYAYHPEDAGDIWKIYDTSVPPYINDLTQLVPGFGYWIKVNADHDWVVVYGVP